MNFMQVGKTDLPEGITTINIKYIQEVGKTDLPKFIITTNIDDEDGYTYIEASPYDKNKPIQIYNLISII